MTEGPAPERGNDLGFPLSFGQERLWLEYLREPRSPSYNIPICIRLTGTVDVDALEQSLSEIVRRHDVLRTRVFVVNEEPRQRVLQPSTANLVVTDLRDGPEAGRRLRATKLVTEEADRPFDLRRGPVFRATLIRTRETEYIFLFVVHQIVFDAWSKDVFLEELGFLYRTLSEGNGGQLPELATRYADFALEQRELVESDAAREGLDYWKEVIGQNPQIMDLPADYPRPKSRVFVGHARVFPVEPSTVDGLKALAQDESATFYVTLLAGFVALLHRYTGQHSIVIGAPVSGRTRPDLARLVGFFVNTIPLKTRIADNPTFRELVRDVSSVVAGAVAHQYVPLEKLVEELHLSHDFGLNPLLQVLFSLETEAPLPRLPGLQIETLDVSTNTARSDLTLTMRETEDGLLATWGYSQELFKEETVLRMAGHLTRLLGHAAVHPDDRLSDLPLLSDTERHQVLIEWNSTEREYPRESRIHELFEEQARLHGERVALVVDTKTMTYGDLNDLANRLARRLRKEGVQRETPVGLCMNRCPDLIVGMLGILKAGGAYVPLDPQYPQERLRYIMEDAAVPVLVMESQCAPTLPQDDRRVVCLDAERERIGEESANDLSIEGRSDDIAYIMYTSGSTGRPKGVCVPHRGVVRLVKGNYYASLGSDEVNLQLHSFAFDASVLDIWGSLLNGGRLIMPSDRLLTHDEIGRIIRDEHVTLFNTSAELFHYVVDADLDAFSGIKQLIAGGNVLSPRHTALFKARFPDCRLLNVYGPTENSTVTTWYEVTGTEAGPLPIGRPIANTTTYILDTYLNPVPVGVVGELCTGGDGLARGYLHDPALTAERFISGSAAGVDSPVLYRTGDMAKHLAEGVICFEGRKDTQVKISGYRIETGEVEAALQACPGVEQATVIARPSPTGDAYIAGYYVPAPTANLTAASLRATLQERGLPEYMVPSLFVPLSQLPLNAQGKVDRHALPDPGKEGSLAGPRYVAPRDSLESTIASIWKRLLGIESVGINDNFFDLGGQSLLALRFFAALEEEIGVRVPIGTLFEAPILERFATLLRDRGVAATQVGDVSIKAGGAGDRPANRPSASDSDCR